MTRPLHTVAETPAYLRDADATGLSMEERAAIVDALAADPMQGKELGGGVRKARVAGRSKGKSGGYRVLTAFVGSEAPVYLLALLSKGERATFTAGEVEGFRKLVDGIARHWRERGRA